MKVLHGTAIYTGGGFYTVLGEFDNGLWFFGGTEWFEVIDADCRTRDEKEDDLAAYYNEWLSKYVVEEYHTDKKKERAMFKAIEDFCRRLDKGEKGLTEGYEELSNYSAGEVTEMIDFSEFDGYRK